MSPTSLLWLRRDLRLHDQPALAAAADAGSVLPVFVLDDTLLSQSAVRTFALLSTVGALNEDYDGALVVRRGPAVQVIPALAQEVGATSVHISTETEPYGRARDTAVEKALTALDNPVPLVRTGSPYALTPGRLFTGGGSPFKVYTPFARAWREHGWRAPAQLPAGLRLARGVHSQPLPAPEAGTVPAEVGALGFGEATARQLWQQFLDEGLPEYDHARDRLDLPGTSRLSMHLKFGTLHPRTLLADLAPHLPTQGATRWMAQLCWREFYADVLWHRPDSAWADYAPSVGDMAYDDPDSDPDVAALMQAWQQGRTGFPVVDAAMRQLVTTGWMHNRTRMITASFLTKDLHVWWAHGARFFLRHLLDGDMANNNHGWQWVAGTGTDAAPYFRIFNPISQGQRFDPDGAYVRRYVPELAHLPGAAAHEPWKHSDGYAHGYPRRIIDHAEERAEALHRYHTTRG